MVNNKRKANKLLIFARDHWVWISLAILALPNIMAYMLLFPGYFQADQQASIALIALGHPRSISSLLWGYFALPFLYFLPSYACYGFVQITLFCGSVIISIWRLRVCHIIKHGLWLAVLYALFPTFILYNQLWTGDICCAYFLIILTTLCFEIIKTKGTCLKSWRYCLVFVLVIVIVCLLRKNAYLICLVTFFVALFITKNVRRKRRRGNNVIDRKTGDRPSSFKYKVRLITTLILSFFASLLIDSGMIYVLGAGPSPSQELLSVPTTQIAAVYHYGGEIPEDANSFLSTIRTPEEWSQSYVSYSADRAKSHVEFSLDFIKSWLEVGMCNPGLYAKSYFILEYPFWSFGSTSCGNEVIYFNGMQIDFSDYDNYTLDYVSNNQDGCDIRQEYISQFGQEKSKLWHVPSSIYRKINEWHIPIVTSVCNDILFNRALPFWVCLIGFIIAVIHRKRRPISHFLFVAAPVIAILCSFLLCAPVALMRYSMEMYYALPILVLAIANLYYKDRKAPTLV